MGAHILYNPRVVLYRLIDVIVATHLGELVTEQRVLRDSEVENTVGMKLLIIELSGNFAGILLVTYTGSAEVEQGQRTH